MKSQTYQMTMLFDFFGEVLTPRQKEFYDLYYNEDLSLSEIAQRFEITRQGVRDVISRAENTLTDLEQKTNIISRFHEVRTQLERLEQSTKTLSSLTKRYDDKNLQEVVVEICDAVTLLQKE